jgi:hypothetical protein
MATNGDDGDDKVIAVVCKCLNPRLQLGAKATSETANLTLNLPVAFSPTWNLVHYGLDIIGTSYGISRSPPSLSSSSPLPLPSQACSHVLYPPEIPSEGERGSRLAPHKFNQAEMALWYAEGLNLPIPETSATRVAYPGKSHRVASWSQSGHPAVLPPSSQVTKGYVLARLVI